MRIACLLTLFAVVVPAAAQEPPPQLQYLTGHAGPVYAVDYTPDAKTIVSGGAGGELNFWDRATGKLLRSAVVHRGPVLAVSVTKDGLQVVSSGRDGKVLVHDVATLNPITPVGALNVVLTALAATPDGKLVMAGDQGRLLRLWNGTTNQHLRDFGGATEDFIGSAFGTTQAIAACKDGSLRVWNTADGNLLAQMFTAPSNSLATNLEQGLLAFAGQDGLVRLAKWPLVPPRTLPNHNAPVAAVAISADGKVALSGDNNGNVILTNTTTAALVRALAGQSGPVSAAAFNSDHTLAATGSDTALIKLWKTANGADAGLLAGHVGRVNSLAFHPQQPQLASAGTDGTVRVWNPPVVAKAFPAGHMQPVQTMSLSRDAKLAITTAADNTIRSWNVADHKAGWNVMPLPQPITRSAIRPDNQQIAIALANGQIEFRSAVKGAVESTLGAHNGPVSAVVYHPQGERLASAGHDGLVKLWQLPITAPQPLPAHADVVQSLVYLPSGTLVSAANDGAVRILDGGKETRKLETGLGPLSALASSADGSLIATASRSGSVRFYNVAEGADRRTVVGPNSPVLGVAIHPTQPLFATAHEDGFVRQWRLPTVPVSLPAQKANVTATAVSPDGKTLATATADGVVQLSSPEGKPIRTLPPHPAPLTAIAFRRDGQHLATADNTGVVRTWNMADGAAIVTLGAHDGPIHALNYHPNHTTLATAGQDGLVKLWQVPAVQPTLPKHEGAASTLAITSDARLAFSGGADKKLRFTDLASGQAPRVLDLPAAATSIAVSADNTFFAVALENGQVKLINVADGAERGRLDAHAGPVRGVAIAPNNTALATVGDDGLRTWEMPAAARFLTAHTGKITAVSATANGQVLATASEDKTVRIWNVASGAATVTVAHEQPPTCVAIKADGTLLVTGGADKFVRVWTVADGSPKAALAGHAAAVTAVGILPDGTKAISGGADGVVKIWTLADGKEAASFAAHDKAVTSLLLSPDATKLITGSEDGRVRIWNLADNQKAVEIAHGQPIVSVAQSPDGRLAVAGADKIVKLYALADGQQTAVLGALAQPITSVAFSPDNLRLAIAAADGRVRVTDLTGQPFEFSDADGSQPTSVLFVGDNRTVAVGLADGRVRLHRTLNTRTIADQKPTCVAYTTDNASVVTGDAAGNVTLWNPAVDAKPVRTYAGNTAAVNDVAVSKDGQTVVAAGADKAVRGWNLPGGNLTFTLTHPAPVKCLQLRADGLRLVTAADDFVRVWDIAANRVVQRFAEPATDVAMSVDGKIVVTARADGMLARAAVADLLVQAAHAGGATSVAFLPNGTQFATVGADKVHKLCDLMGNVVRQNADAQAPLRCLAVRPDAMQFAFGGDDRTLYVARVDNGTFEQKIATPAAVTAVAFSPDNTRVVAGGADNHLRVYETATGRLLEDVTDAGPVAAVNFVDPLTLLAATDPTAKVHSLSYLRTLAGHAGAVSGVAYTPDGGFLITGGADKTVRGWNQSNFAQAWSVSHADAVTSVAVSKDNVVWTTSVDKTIRAWTPSNGAAGPVITGASPIRRASLVADAMQKRLVTTSDDGLVQVWDLTLARELQRLAPAGGQPTAVALAADGKTVAFGAADKKAFTWPLSIVKAILADPGKVYETVFTPDGSQLLSAGDDKLVKLWDAEGKLVRQFTGAGTPPRRLAVRADGKQLAAGGDPTLAHPNTYVWDFTSGAALPTIAAPAGVTGLAFSGDNKLAIAAADKRLRVYLPENGRLLHDQSTANPVVDLAFTDNKTLVGVADNNVYSFEHSLVELIAAHEGGATGVAFSLDGTRLITAGADKTAKLWNRADGKLLAVYAGSPAAISSLSVSRDGLKLAAACADNQVRVWNATPPDGAQPGAAIQPLLAIPAPAALRSVSLNETGSTVAFATDDAIIRLWDVATNKERERLVGHGSAIYSVALSADGRTLISGGADNTARNFTPAVTHVLAGHEGPVIDAAISGDVFTSGADKTVRQWSVTESKLVRQLPGPTAPVKALAASRDGKFVVGGGDDLQLRVWSAADGQLVAATALPAAITSVSLSPDGRKIIVGSADKLVRNFALVEADGKQQLQLVHEMAGHTEAVTRVVLTGDEHRLLTASADKSVLRWHAASAAPRLSLAAHRGPVYAAALSNTGKLLATAGNDRIIRVWDFATGQELFKCEGHTRQITSLAFRSGDRQLASVSLDRSIRFWSTYLPPATPPAVDPAKPPPPEPPPAGTLIDTIDGEQLGDGLLALSYAKDGNSVFVGGLSKKFQRWAHTATKTNLGFELSIHNAPVVRAALNPGGTRLVTLDASGHLFIFETTNHGLLFHQQLTVPAASDITYSPDGRELAVATHDPRVIRVQIPAAAQ